MNSYYLTENVLKKIPFEFAQTVQGLSPRVRGPASAAGGGDQGVAGLVQRRQAIRFQVIFSSMANIRLLMHENYSDIMLVFRPAWEFGGGANPPRGEEDPVGASAGRPSPVLRHLTTFRGVLAGDLTLEREDEIFVPGSSAGSTDQLRNICLVSESVKNMSIRNHAGGGSPNFFKGSRLLAWHARARALREGPRRPSASHQEDPAAVRVCPEVGIQRQGETKHLKKPKSLCTSSK